MFKILKYALKVVQKPMNKMCQVYLVYNNVIWSSLNELQKWIHNLMMTNNMGKWPKSIYQLIFLKLLLQLNDQQITCNYVLCLHS
jgi:hypothetical protein